MTPTFPMNVRPRTMTCSDQRAHLQSITGNFRSRPLTSRIRLFDYSFWISLKGALPVGRNVRNEKSEIGLFRSYGGVSQLHRALKRQPECNIPGGKVTQRASDSFAMGKGSVRYRSALRQISESPACRLLTKALWAIKYFSAPQ